MQKKKIGIYILGFFLLFFLSLFGYFIWKRYHYAVTDAVFVQADRLVYVSFPKINGKLIKLYKKEGDWIKEGEILAELEPFDYEKRVTQLEESVKEVSSQRASLFDSKRKLEREIILKIEQIQKQLESLQAKKRAQIAKLEAIKARLDLVRKDRLRLENLYKEGLISQQSLEAKETEEKELNHQLEAEKELLNSIERDIKALEKTRTLLENEIFTVKSLASQIEALKYKEKALLKQKEEALLYYEYTKLKSPITGVIAKKFHSEGDVIAPGEPIYVVVDPESFYILVLLEETKLKGIKKGAYARIRLDAYPGKVWEGEVEEILPASAATFALVPRDISAGEFTKLAQRIPVKIKITKGDRGLLKVGLGGEVEIKRVR
ncbi:secretion protein HlyD family protein [Caldimicrobium thiodismutans]|uniref:Secretion protein HlyD family protein n=1 Tax=Caldimicrobium thiodismutans TaxID=1653476 RepID=A0A0U5AVW7_9BACT|nr:HlyD family secretion protein [Caldimicrobium thiodismutans]BAU23432.1 secretion protein HlyD family protein [Caldimicrobium thiodismutans]